MHDFHITKRQMPASVISIKHTLGPSYNDHEHPAITSRFLCTILINSNIKKFGYNEHPPTTMNSFFCIYFLVVSRTQCKCTFNFSLLPWLIDILNSISELISRNYTVRNVFVRTTTAPRTRNFTKEILSPSGITCVVPSNFFYFSKHCWTSIGPRLYTSISIKL